MAFGLVLKSDRANVFQSAIENELVRKGYSAEPDATMSEYITIMVINNKAPSEISKELEDLIGPEFEPSFTDWLFTEAGKGKNQAQEADHAPKIADSVPVSVPVAKPAPIPAPAPPTAPPESGRRASQTQPRNGVFNQALSQVLPSAGQKRTASARSPSPGNPNKFRKTEPPTAPRAHRDVPISNTNPRSLLDRVGGPTRNNNNTATDPMILQMENMGASPEQAAMLQQLMATGQLPGPDMGAMNGMMNPMNNTMNNPLVLQDMMMNQMAMMAQMASSMGLLNPATGQFNNSMMPGPGVENIQNGFSNGGGRSGGRGTRGRGRGVSPHITSHHPPNTSEPIPSSPHQPSIASPTPVPPQQVIAAPALPYALPERPSSPTLCKFGLKCTNSQCRYSHPSPVATAESGVVLSNDPCENGKDCKDKDCIKAHVSPAVLNPQAHPHTAPPPPPTFPVSQSTTSCRYGAACTRPACAFSHPTRTTASAHSQSCRFGAACTRATCQFQHPEGRVLPNTFHRGVAVGSHAVTIKAPETGSIGVPSQHRSVTFNKSQDMKERLEKQMKELEEQKSQLEAKMAGKAHNITLEAS